MWCRSAAVFILGLCGTHGVTGPVGVRVSLCGRVAVHIDKGVGVDVPDRDSDIGVVSDGSCACCGEVVSGPVLDGALFGMYWTVTKYVYLGDNVEVDRLCYAT